MTFLDALAEQNDIQGEVDFVGRSLLQGNMYPAQITMAYTTESSNGALGLTLHANLKVEGSEDPVEFRETIWMTNRSKQNYYVNKETGAKHYLPGFNIVNALCSFIDGKTVQEMFSETQQQTVPVWNSEQNKEVPTQVTVVTGLLNGIVTLGIAQHEESRTKKEGNEYVPTGETFKRNVLDRVFEYETNLTKSEKDEGKEQGEWFERWMERHFDKVIDRTKAGTSRTGTAGAPNTGKGTPNPSAKKLFS